MIKELKFGKYGTVAQKIYDECCEAFEWDVSEGGNFAKQKKLYSSNADKKGKNSVWFIANSNWTDTKVKKWENNILIDTIEEEYKSGERPDFNDKKNRIVFAKKSNGYYYFIGVYCVEEQSESNRIYKRISMQYPY